MKDKFEFQEVGHKYTLNGKPLTGCTTILGVIAKPALIQWSANMAVAYIEGKKNEINEMFKDGGDEAMDNWEKLLKEAKTAHRRKKEDAGQKGTDVHEIIENLIKQAMQLNEGYLDLFKHDNKQVQNFIDWAVNNKVQFLESEKKMYSKVNWVAGTVDFTCIMDGKKYVGDIKTSSGIYSREPFAQCACYRMMLEEMGEKDFEGSIIINIKKTGVFDEEKDVHFSPYYEDDLKLFLSALSIYRIINNFKK